MTGRPAKLHAEEFDIDEALVRRLLVEQMADWADLPLRASESSGTMHVSFRLGDHMVVRLPRTPAAADGPVREAHWMPRLAPLLPLTVPAHLALGSATDAYPSSWSVLEWVEGEPASRTTLTDLHEAALTLGHFVAALQRIPTDGVPARGSARALGLQPVDGELRSWLQRLPPGIDRSAVLAEWDACLAAGTWTDAPRWLHADLRGDNLIARRGRLVAVIDWEGCAVGDPSADYLAAWWLFDQASRETFRLASGAHRRDWLRAKGWAMFMAVAAIPYYHATNPRFAGQARAALLEVLSDE